MFRVCLSVAGREERKEGRKEEKDAKKKWCLIIISIVFFLSKRGEGNTMHGVFFFVDYFVRAC